MQNRLDLLKNQGMLEVVVLPFVAGEFRIAEAILYLFHYYAEVYKMREMVEFIIDLKDVFVSKFNTSDDEIVNKVANENEKIFLAFDNEKGLFISENENGNDVVIGKIRGKFKTFGSEYMVEGEI